MESTQDVTNRDPNEINRHIKVQFEDVLAEVDGAHSAVCVWTTSTLCFGCSKTCCYNVLSALCGLFIALYWGFQFACLTFSHVWCVTPCTRYFTLNCNSIQICFGTMINCFLSPICESCSLFFNKIVVKQN